ncbi:MAG: hypothetical protein QW795_03375 [Candidatus Bathyarchaeia archaeon]
MRLFTACSRLEESYPPERLAAAALHLVRLLLIDKYLSKIEQLTLILSFVIMFLSSMLIATSIIQKKYSMVFFGLFVFCLGEWFALSECFKMVKRAEKGEVKKCMREN